MRAKLIQSRRLYIVLSLKTHSAVRFYYQQWHHMSGMLATFTYRISANSFHGNYSFLEVYVKCGNFHIDSALCMANFYFINWIAAAETIQGGKYSREETIRGLKVCKMSIIVHWSRIGGQNWVKFDPGGCWMPCNLLCISYRVHGLVVQT